MNKEREKIKQTEKMNKDREKLKKRIDERHRQRENE